ncbi:MAG: peptidase inhibitor family I36 protein [Streptosporangiaceae bacterium]
MPLAGLAATVSALVITAPAFAQNSHVTSAAKSSPATPRLGVQHNLKAEIKAQLRYNPSGKVISPDEISYDHGHVVITLVSTTKCPSGYACLWEDYNFGGPMAKFNGPHDVNINLRGYLPEQGSLKTYYHAGAILSNGKGGTVCYPTGQWAANISAPYRNYPYLYLENSADC